MVSQVTNKLKELQLKMCRYADKKKTPLNLTINKYDNKGFQSTIIK